MGQDSPLSSSKDLNSKCACPARLRGGEMYDTGFMSFRAGKIFAKHLWPMAKLQSRARRKRFDVQNIPKEMCLKVVESGLTP